MYENQGRASQMVGYGADANFAAQGATLGKASQPDLPLLDYATQEIQRLANDLANQVREVNSFVDSVRGPVPTLLGHPDSATNMPVPPPNRGEALREAIRNPQVIRNAGDEAVKRLGGI
jgi:hypothetical protein